MITNLKESCVNMMIDLQYIVPISFHTDNIIFVCILQWTKRIGNKYQNMCQIQTRNCSNLSETSESDRVFMLPCGDGPKLYGAPLLISESPEGRCTRRGHVAALLSPVFTVLRTNLSNYEITKQSKQDNQLIK